MSSKWKTVRVFISSTFLDMQAERDHLVRFFFPRLREKLLPRRIHLLDVDLRWGVTSEEDATEVCREIITECRPRFLCMIGGRYGTIPDGKEFSITDDEVHFGVLNEHHEKIYALFYFRDGAVTVRMDKSDQGAFREPKYSEKSRKLARLKRDIRNAKYRPFIYHPLWVAHEQKLLELKEFGDRVELDILATIEDEFGSETTEQLDEFAEENTAMEAFVEERNERFVLGSRENVLNNLIYHTISKDDKGYLCLTGPPGSGKSALLAHLSTLSTFNNKASIVLIRHFIGASIGSTDERLTMRRLCHELKENCLEITADIPDDQDKLRIAFRSFLQTACVEKRVVILLDALDQFEAVSYRRGLQWLPEDLPPNARIILSALSSPTLEIINRRLKSQVALLEPLTSADGLEIIDQFRKRYRKKFEADQLSKLMAKADSGTPLYLLTALEELRTLSTYNEITQRIAELPPTSQELFRWILKRLENDNGFRDPSGQKIGKELVTRFVLLLCASRFGLSRRELVDLLDPTDPQGNIAALLQLLRPYLMYRGELIDFYHRQFRLAANQTVLHVDVHNLLGHTTLANYFDMQIDPEGDYSFNGPHRALQELLYHLDGAGSGSPALRLLELEQCGFMRKRLSITNDVSEVSREYRYLFRACLREQNLERAISIAKSRSGLSNFEDWLIADYIVEVLPHLSGTSHLWEKIRRSILNIEPVENRVKLLTNFLIPGADHSILEWLRFRFDCDAKAVDNRLRLEFLCALAKSEEGCISYLLNAAKTYGLNGKLVTIIIEQLGPLCKNSQSTIKSAMNELINLVAQSEESFTALVDVLNRNENLELASKWLSYLESSFSRLNVESQLELSRSAAALSHTFFLHGQKERAEALIKKCLAHIPKELSNPKRPISWGAEIIDLGIRLLIASGPFQEIWPTSHSKANSLISFGSNESIFDRIEYVKGIGGKLKALPWVKSQVQRMELIQTTLAEISQTMNNLPVKDSKFQFLETFTSNTTRNLLAEEINKGFDEVFERIDRVLPSESKTECLYELLLAAAKVNGEQGDTAANLFFKRVIPLLAKSSDINVLGLALDLYVQIVGAANWISNESGEVLKAGLSAVAKSSSRLVFGQIINFVFEQVEHHWIQKNRKAIFFLPNIVLQVAITKRSAEIIDEFADKFLQWQKDLGTPFDDMLAVKWGASLIVLGQRENGNRIINQVLAKNEIDEKVNQLSMTLRIIIVKTFLEVGVHEPVSALLQDFLVDRIEMNDTTNVREPLKIAGYLLRAGQGHSARHLFLDVAQEYRNRFYEWESGDDAPILNCFYNVGDSILTQQLLQLAENEFVVQCKLDSSMAARWYVMLALASIGGIDSCEELRNQLDDWPKQKHLADVRSSLVALLNSNNGEGDSPQQVLGKLKIQLDEITQPDILEIALEMLARLFTKRPFIKLTEALELNLLAAKRVAGFSNKFDSLISVICEQLSRIQDEQLVASTIEQIVELLSVRPESTLRKSLIITESALNPLLTLINKVSNTNRFHRILELLLLKAMEIGHNISRAEFVAEAITEGFKRLDNVRAQELLKYCVKLCDDMVKEEGRVNIMFALAETALSTDKTNELSSIISILIQKIELIFVNPSGEWMETRSRFYKAMTPHSKLDEITKRLAQDIQHDGPPFEVEYRSRWAANLLGTPLHTIGWTAAEELINNPDRFTTGFSDLESLEYLLKAMVEYWSVSDDADEQFIRLSNWVATMPKVRNEDGRRFTYIKLAKAASILEYSSRKRILPMILNSGLANLNDHGRKEIARLFGLFSLESKDAILVIELYLDKVETSGEKFSRLELLLDLIVESVLDREFSRGSGYLDALCILLDKRIETPVIASWSELAKIACAITHDGLKNRLGKILRDHYIQDGLNKLNEDELFYLSNNNPNWWIEHSTDIYPNQMNRAKLLTLIESFAVKFPNGAITMIILTMAWLSENTPNSLHDFLFDIATSSVILPENVRSILNKSIS